MSEKRFTLKHFEDTDWAYDNNKPIHIKEMVDLLNNLHEENEQLKKDISDWKASAKDYHQLGQAVYKKNKQLKQQIKDCLDSVPFWETALDEKNKLEKENEQLKFENKDLRNDAIKFEKECKRLWNNLRITNGDWKYEELMHKKLEKENEQLKIENKELKSNVIDLIDKKINKLKNINKVSVIPRESVEILKELKKELEE